MHESFPVVSVRKDRRFFFEMFFVEKISGADYVIAIL